MRSALLFRDRFNGAIAFYTKRSSEGLRDAFGRRVFSEVRETGFIC